MKEHYKFVFNGMVFDQILNSDYPDDIKHKAKTLVTYCFNQCGQIITKRQATIAINKRSIIKGILYNTLQSTGVCLSCAKLYSKPQQ